MSICSLCVHSDACQAWVRHGQMLYGDFEYETDNCSHFTNSYDLVKVVHCEDCKYRVLDTVSGEDWCNHTLGLCSEVYATDFCCHGERKDNEPD